MKYLRTIKTSLAGLLLLLASSPVMAQNTATQPEMADVMRSEGKIYVVVAVLVIIFIGIVVYLFSLSRKMNKLEKLLTDTTLNKKIDRL